MKLTDVALRTGIWFLALTELAVGLVATLAPRAFYDHVPGVSLLPPYSEHLMRDVGALSLAITVVLFVAAITMEQLIVRTALIAYLVFAIPHLLFHVTHHHHHAAAVAVTETTGLVVAVLLPIGLLILQLRAAVGLKSGVHG
jgi:Ca2+/Na+ antiporter